MKSLIAVSAILAALTLSTDALANQAPQPAPAKTTTKAAQMPPPSATEIADAQSKGLVWVNTSTRVYHKDGVFYGKTKRGKFMAEADAQKEGYRAAKDSSGGKKKASPSPK